MNDSRTPIILASQSPRRIELLKQVVSNFQVIPSEIDEVCNSNLSPEENAVYLGQQKADSVARLHPDHWVIGADTLVVLDDEIIGKPANVEDACQILRRLSGREHKVITGIAVIHSNILSEAIVSRVRFKILTEKEITAYVNSGEPMDKAGAYAIQGKGSVLIEGYTGSYSNIVGLPIKELKDLLCKSGFPFNSLT